MLKNEVKAQSRFTPQIGITGGIILTNFKQHINNDFENQKFSLAHLDVDTYLSTLKCLNFLHDKMSKNSLIIVHDYNAHLPGVTKAVNEFCYEKNMENHYVDNLSNCQTLISYA
jgi:hypothetical protein